MNSIEKVFFSFICFWDKEFLLPKLAQPSISASHELSEVGFVNAKKQESTLTVKAGMYGHI